MPQKGLFTSRKLLLFLSAIFILALADYQLFLKKSRDIELHDELNQRLNSVRGGVIKLEYLLDMYVVASKFEANVINIIRDDVDKLDSTIKELDDPEYKGIIKGNKLIAEGMSSLADDWLRIKGEIARLNAALSMDEVMLMHGAVDTDTIVVTEKSERLLGTIAESRKEAFNSLKLLALETIAGFIILCLLITLVFYKRVLRPLTEATMVALDVRAGNLKARFRESKRGVAGGLARELNSMLNSLAETEAFEYRKNIELATSLKDREEQIASVAAILRFAGASISTQEIKSEAARGILRHTGAEGAAVYIKGAQGAPFKLKAWAGFDDEFVKAAGEAALGGIENDECCAVSTFPDAGLSKALADRGFTMLACMPLRFNNEITGCLLAAYSGYKNPEADLPFLEALAAGLGALAGHLNLFKKELDSKRFLERFINQMPFGAAVFDRSGACLLSNSSFFRLMGPYVCQSGQAGYMLFSDNSLISAGALTSIKKIFEGYSTDFMVEYPANKFKITGIPLYDTGGEISSIALFYNDMDEDGENALQEELK